MYCRNRTPSEFIGYGLYLYFLGLSFRNATKALKWFIKISHVSIWKWIQKYKPKKIFTKKRKIDGYIIDETLIKVGSSEYIWLWVIIEPNDKEILAIDISKERNMFVARAFSIPYCKRIWSTFCFN
jgi:putative transposase